VIASDECQKPTHKAGHPRNVTHRKMGPASSRRDPRCGWGGGENVGVTRLPKNDTKPVARKTGCMKPIREDENGKERKTDGKKRPPRRCSPNRRTTHLAG